jgi:two-component system capsular synthesis response regulator RcsB
MRRKILVADDHPIVREALQVALEASNMFSVTADAKNGNEVLSALRNSSWDILISDYSMREDGVDSEDGLRLISRIKREFPKLPIIVFTMVSNTGIICQLSSIGVDGIVSKDESPRFVIDACSHILNSANAACYHSPAIRLLIDQALCGESGETSIGCLSARELEVVRLYASGMSLTEIAQQEKRSITTVATQKISAMRKLKIATNTDLIKYAYDVGLV